MAHRAGACRSKPPIACIAISDKPAYPEPAYRFLPSFHNELWTCMPEPLSMKIGLGMNVDVLTYLLAAFLRRYLYFSSLSAIPPSGATFLSVSPWPPDATSRCWASVLSPQWIMVGNIPELGSWRASDGGTGK